MLIDSHCHLDFPDYDSDRDEIINRARATGVEKMLTISTKLSEAEKIIALAEQYDDVFCTLGTHPHEADKEPLLQADEIVALTAHPKVIGIGETGLDYFYENSAREVQLKNFLTHIDAARIAQLPLIVHTRDADDDTIKIMREEYEKGAYPALIHCFTAGADLAAAALDMGFYISISGIATFKNAEDLRAVITTIPLNRLLVETDAPFLAPVPHRGKRNEPAFVTHTADCVAALKQVTREELIAATGDNFHRLFTKAPA